MAINTLELLVRKTAVLEIVDESIVEQVIRFKWASVSEALRISTSVEDSGLGKYKIRQGVVTKKEKQILGKIKFWTERFENEEDQRKKETIERRLSVLNQDLEYLKSKK